MSSDDLVRQALERARADAAGRGEVSREGPVPGRSSRRSRTPRAATSGIASVGDLLGQWVTDSGSDVEVAVARVLSCWPQVVGEDIAAHCQAQSLEHGVLHVVAESTAWATQLRLLAPTLVTRIKAELAAHSERADELLREVRVTGPVGPSWKRGRLSVKGRGPRDTYG